MLNSFVRWVITPQKLQYFVALFQHLLKDICIYLLLFLYHCHLHLKVSKISLKQAAGQKEEKQPRVQSGRRSQDICEDMLLVNEREWNEITHTYYIQKPNSYIVFEVHVKCSSRRNQPSKLTTDAFFFWKKKTFNNADIEIALETLTWYYPFWKLAAVCVSSFMIFLL